MLSLSVDNSSLDALEVINEAKMERKTFRLIKLHLESHVLLIKSYLSTTTAFKGCKWMHCSDLELPKNACMLHYAQEYYTKCSLFILQPTFEDFRGNSGLPTGGLRGRVCGLCQTNFRPQKCQPWLISHRQTACWQVTTGQRPAISTTLSFLCAHRMVSKCVKAWKARHLMISTLTTQISVSPSGQNGTHDKNQSVW